MLISGATVIEWVANRTQANPRSAQSAIGWLRDDELTCGVFYEGFTGSSITATIAIENGAVMPKDFLWAIFDYPFRQLGCIKMLAFIGANNWKSENLVKKMGFELEASIAGYYPGEALLIYSMTKDQCRWLEKEHGQEIQNS